MSKTTEKRQDARQPQKLRDRVPIRHAIACIDTTPASRQIIPHALAITNALGATLTMVHVIEAPPADQGPSDPVAWELRRREAQAHVDALAREDAGNNEKVTTRILEGHSAEQIAECAHQTKADLTCMCTHGTQEATEGELGETARRVVAAAAGSILLVPPSAPSSKPVKYTKVFVPLDGSPRAESALSSAVDIAHAYGAELILVHATPELHLTRVGPFEAEDEELARRLQRRNERVASEYLKRVRAHLVERKLVARTLVLTGGDVRRQLAHAITEQNADLVVLASHGHSGHPDVAAGDVAKYLMGHTAVPLLIVRTQTTRHHSAGSSGVRLPDRSD